MKQQLMLVAMLSVGTALTTMGRIKPVAASLTPPASYDYSYTWNATTSEQYLNVNGVDSIPIYTRTADGIYFNYTSTFNVVDGLSVTQTFFRSNTTWQTSGTFYKPDENRIGSNNAVGSLPKKIDFILNNQTNNDYYLYVDLSSTSHAFTNFRVSYDSLFIGGWTTGTEYPVIASNFILIYIPSFVLTNFYIDTGADDRDKYFDAWYLKDLGISEAYQNGLDAETDGILTDYLGTDAQQIGWVLIGIAAILFAFKGGK
jgi:hypothetical protein